MLGSRFARSATARLLVMVLIVAACSPNQPSLPPATGPAPTSLATSAADAACDLDPAQSDAGVVGCVTLANDSDGNRDGRYDIIGLAADGSECPVSPGGTEFMAIAVNLTAPSGQVSRLSVSVPADTVPQADGEAADISGRVSFEVAGGSTGSTYTGDASQDDGQSTIDVRRLAGKLTFDFTGRTARNASFRGQVACTTTGPMPSASTGGGETPIVAFSDPSALDEAAWNAQLPLLEIACRSVQPQERPSFESAMADVRSWLDGATGGGLAALEAAGVFGDEAIASAGAAELATGGEFAAALALTLQSHRAEPDDPRHLVNAAALLDVLGRPGDAVAFLDRAATMRPPDATPMGIDQVAVTETIRGLALSSEGRFTEAADVLRSAVDRDPNLTEAADNLAGAEVCLGRGRAAFPMVNRPRRDQVSRLPAGRPGTLPDLKLPARPADTVELSDLYQELVNESIDRLMARMERQSALQATGLTRYASPASLARVQGIRALIGLVEGSPEVVALWDEVVARGDELDSITQEMWGTSGAAEQASNRCANTDDYNGCFRAWCVPTTQGRHAQWRGVFDSYETALRNAYAATSQRENALAGLVADPVWFEILSLDIEDTADRWFYDYLAGKALDWSRMTAVQGAACIDGEGEDTGTPPEEPGSDATPCDPGRYPHGLMPVVRFPGARAKLEISARCEEFRAEITGPGIDRLGLLKPFGQIKATGKGVTVFAGVKAGLTIDPVSANAKLGAYWTVDYQGNVTDYGVRVAPGSATLESGPFGIKVWEAQAMDFSFVGITDYMPLIGTQ